MAATFLLCKNVFIQGSVGRKCNQKRVADDPEAIEDASWRHRDARI